MYRPTGSSSVKILFWMLHHVSIVQHRMLKIFQQVLRPCFGTLQNVSTVQHSIFKIFQQMLRSCFGILQNFSNVSTVCSNYFSTLFTIYITMTTEGDLLPHHWRVSEDEQREQDGVCSADSASGPADAAMPVVMCLYSSAACDTRSSVLHQPPSNERSWVIRYAGNEDKVMLRARMTEQKSKETTTTTIKSNNKQTNLLFFFYDITKQANKQQRSKANKQECQRSQKKALCKELEKDFTIQYQKFQECHGNRKVLPVHAWKLHHNGIIRLAPQVTGARTDHLDMCGQQCRLTHVNHTFSLARGDCTVWGCADHQLYLLADHWHNFWNWPKETDHRETGFWHEKPNTNICNHIVLGIG